MWVLLLVELSSVVVSELVLMNTGVVVPIGRSVHLTEHALQFRPVGPNEECRVMVEVNEPYYMRVGSIQPQVGLDLSRIPDVVEMLVFCFCVIDPK